MGNGTMTPAQLVTVAPGHELAVDAAHDYQAMLNAGMPGHIATPYGAYRTVAAQTAMHKLPASDWTAPLAPIGYSPHGTGECVDIVPAAAVAWVEKWGSGYGWHRRAANDPNCFIHTGGQHTTTPASVGTVTPVTAAKAIPGTPERKANTMGIKLVQTSDSKTFYVLNQETGKVWPINQGTSAQQQTNAEKVDRVLNYVPSLTDLRYYAQLVSAPAVAI